MLLHAYKFGDDTMSALAKVHERNSCQDYRHIICCLKNAEVCEIERHKYCVSQECGYDVGFEEAAEDWLENHAQAWREARQQKMLSM